MPKLRWWEEPDKKGGVHSNLSSIRNTAIGSDASWVFIF